MDALAHGWRSQIHQAERANLNDVAIAQVSVFHIGLFTHKPLNESASLMREAGRRAFDGRMHARNRHVV